LAKHGYFTVDEFRQRAEAAASYFVGNLRRLQTTIDIVCTDIEHLEPPPASAPGTR
jgi:hypothetical protein